MQRYAMAAQFVLSCVVGCALWLITDEPGENPKARMIIAVVGGLGAAWLATFLWTWARHGWRAARGLSLGG